MSLFGNLFRADNGGASQLFSPNNPYLALSSSAADADADTGVDAALDAAIGQLEQLGGKRKRKAANLTEDSQGLLHAPQTVAGEPHARERKQLASKHAKKRKRDIAQSDSPAADAQQLSQAGSAAAVAPKAAPSDTDKAPDPRSKRALDVKPAKGSRHGGTGHKESPPQAQAAVPQAATPGPEVAALGQLRALQSAPDEEQASGDQAAAEHEAAGGRYTEEQVARTIFVGNVAVHRGQQRAKSALKAALRGYGTIENIRLRNLPVDTESNMPKALQIKAGKVEGARCNATAYMRFATCEEATSALAANMTIIDGAHVRVDMAAAPSSKAGAVQYEPKRSVFLGNLAFDTQEEDVIQLFNTAVHEPQLAGAVEGVRLVRDPKTNLVKGIGYVLFKTRTAALAALNMNDVECKGRKLRVQRVKAAAGGVSAVKVVGKQRGKVAAATGQRGSGGGGGTGKGLVARLSGDAAQFGGARTKGKGKVVARSALAAGSTGGAGVAKGKISSRAAKRPAVAARKAQAKAAAGLMSASDAKAARVKAGKRGRAKR